MSLQTSLRFESMQDKRRLREALNKQQERIENDEMVASRECQQKTEDRVTLVSDWMEGLEVAAQRRKACNDRKHAHNTLIMTRKAAIKVRRAALQTLLANEYEMYEQELNRMGKSFYIKRT